ncbi:alpha-1,3-mannosyl-glycoprotein 2-beta-N-acetylglucosaminyltransferase-like [Paramacrobiotus metropolitanus]|uniref:alpha-1,3-mannosyl-glycoprotein 2-beta-N-acetylglucosaminyltransferase-like n=1 Tax=Paramacrobiotus metropolitanus TaxID=2943436 RepID=UPI002445F548|nr:alpha-1,3-mannosyl-glycoprotein 2-beta-N-acetylglucosaminyltransferase-like [Paramacrobiotus metropolitanus]
MKRKLGYFIASGITILWVLFFYQYVLFHQNIQELDPNEGANRKIKHLSALFDDVHNLEQDSEKIKQYVERVQEVIGVDGGDSSLAVLRKEIPVIPVIVFGCNRPTIKRSLDQLIKFRPSAQSFPVYVSQDCGDAATADAIASYGDQLTHLKHTNNTPINLSKKDKKFEGYYKIARHYKWGLQQMFRKYNYSAVIIVEDDLDVAPDFFQYFAALYPLLALDTSLWCISAWNDNGKADLTENNAELLHRTDFFPGLGWMLTKEIWNELEPKWPEKFWDDWMRRPEQRQQRSCIRPEISRTSTFGKKGVSNGEFFETHLKFIKLNDVAVPFRERNLAYLLKEIYDPRFNSIVYNAPVIRLDDWKQKEIVGLPDNAAVRIEYRTKDQFIKIAKAIGVMQDFKAGVPRGGYRGVVTLVHRGRRVFLAPPAGWDGYDLTWN